MRAFVKKYWKELAILVLLLLIIALGYLAWERINTLQRRVSESDHLADSAWQAVKYYKDKSGKAVAQINTLNLTVNDLTALGQRLGTNVQALKQQIGSMSNLIVYYKGQAGFKGRDTVKVHDTTFVDLNTGKKLDAETAFWTNGYLSLNTSYFPATKQFLHDYKYDIGGFELTAYRKPTGFLGLGKGKVLSDLKFGDQNMRVTKFEGYHVVEGPTPLLKTRGFSFGLGAAVMLLLRSKL